MTDDVVAELDRWANDTRRLPGGDAGTDLLKRARDEIVALRQKNVEVLHLVAGEIKRRARDEALEEAVQACTDQTSDDPPPGTYNDACEDCAAAIRALKEQH